MFNSIAHLTFLVTSNCFQFFIR